MEDREDCLFTYSQLEEAFNAGGLNMDYDDYWGYKPKKTFRQWYIERFGEVEEEDGKDD